MFGLVKHARACPTLSKIRKRHCLWEGWSYFVYLLHLVTHPWKLQGYHVVLVGYGIVLWNIKLTISGKCWVIVLIFCWVICILLDIHWSYKNLLFWLTLSGIGSQPIRLSCFKLRKLENPMKYQVDLCFHWSCKNIVLF